MAHKKNDIENKLRRAIVESDLSRYEISKRSGVAASQLSYFVNGKRTLRLDSAAKVAEILKLDLTPKKEGK
jgi:transcriptional regulator with XRE-family HTH domain